MLKLIIIAVIAFSILGAIVYFIFKPSPSTPLPISQRNESRNTYTNLADIKIDPSKIKPPPQPVVLEFHSPESSESSGTVKISQIIGKTLVEVKSNDPGDKISLITKGTCTTNGQVVYPLATLENGASNSIWETTFAKLKSQLPLSIKTFKDMKNLKSYTRCAEIKF